MDSKTNKRSGSELTEKFLNMLTYVGVKYENNLDQKNYLTSLQMFFIFDIFRNFLSFKCMFIMKFIEHVC